MNQSQRPSLAEAERKYSKDLIYEIGFLFVIAGVAEHALALQLGRLLAYPHAFDPASVAALIRTPTKARLEQMQALAHCRLISEKAAGVIAVCEKIGDSFAQRNQFAHFHDQSRRHTGYGDSKNCQDQGEWQLGASKAHDSETDQADHGDAV
jgi:hypothetical protein